MLTETESLVERASDSVGEIKEQNTHFGSSDVPLEKGALTESVQ